ncbi:glycerol-3-phosphate dehydrogenase [Fulvitalea axinellae]|uniref:Glycerol-3-phosphate dehydrogenase n=1 Tax=Fulvitalea axinellae TaxID=1182444 RepID=A0AAU9CEA1_9BACT|nr:glycerol-3-phosphate dehydrogenase [Fulvitalea axinellae]
MDRENMLCGLRKRGAKPWDMIIIGGGATGLGIAVDSASRGYDTLLLERTDFAKGTSSRSTKLVHGGVRYLAQGDVGMVKEALAERALMMKNAPHLVRNMSFVVPAYSFWDGLRYTAGLKLYDLMAGKASFGASVHLGKEAILKRIPTLNRKGLKGGIRYQDGQFDDSRMAVNLAQTAHEHGGVPLNYMEVKGLRKNENGKIEGVFAQDLETGEEFELPAKAVVNATGVFTDEIHQLDKPGVEPTVMPSQGVHIVLDSSFLGNSQQALMIPETSDGRILFAVPWHGVLVVGTTDTAVRHADIEPKALDEEVDFILDTAGFYLDKKPKREDVLSVFAGLRPLVKSGDKENPTKNLSRGHKVSVSASGLVSVSGGKWTTYRKMAEDAVNVASRSAGLNSEKCRTKDLKIHGYSTESSFFDHLGTYGADNQSVLDLAKTEPGLGDPLIAGKPYLKAQVVWAVRNEMARTVEDVLARRLRFLFLDAKSAVEAAPATAKLMADEMGKDRAWELAQCEDFAVLASSYKFDCPSKER